MYDYFKKKYLYIDIKDFYCEVSVFMLLSQIKLRIEKELVLNF